MNQDTTSAFGQAAAPASGEPLSLVGDGNPAGDCDWTPRTGKIGICCSGGGVRSASFNLGALQALQEAGVLEEAEYLASVSGGGYTAAAMAMVADSPGKVFGAGQPQPFAPGSPEETYLRNRSSYLAPGVTGKLRLLANLLRGMLLNVVVLAAALALAGTVLGRLESYRETAMYRDDLLYDVLTVGGGWAPVLLLGAVVALLLYRGVFRARSARVEDTELLLMRIAWRAALGLWLLLVVAPFAVQLVVDITSKDGGANDTSWLADRIAWLYGLVGAGDGKPDAGAEAAPTTLAQLAAILAAIGVPALIAGAARSVFAEAGSVIGRLAIWVAFPLLCVTGLLVAAAERNNGTELWEYWLVAAAIAVLLFAFFLADINAGSMHRFYKRRLCTAFGLERVWRDPEGGLHRENPPEGSRLDAVERDYDALVKLSAAVRGDVGNGHRWPKMVLCAAANIGDETVTPPGRNAVTFTFEPDWIGGPQVGYAPTLRYESVLGTVRGEDITIPAAVAISGAALAPCMGVMTKPYLRALLTLVNARLGVWLPSPHWVRTHTPSQARRARPTFGWLLREMNGRNELDSDFLYVTDGGHWENLGLVELLRRGCGTIYCIDASGDKEETFFTIGQAISMANSELGVRIQLKPDDMRADPAKKPPYSKHDFVEGTITFTRVPGRPGEKVEGTIVFIKAQVTADAPWDVRAYKEKDAQFPNHSLLEQMFADQTFEAYRALGYHSAGNAVRAQVQRAAGGTPPGPPGAPGVPAVPDQGGPAPVESFTMTTTTTTWSRSGS